MNEEDGKQECRRSDEQLPTSGTGECHAAPLHIRLPQRSTLPMTRVSVTRGYGLLQEFLARQRGSVVFSLIDRAFQDALAGAVKTLPRRERITVRAPCAAGRSLL
jgi:hypothetical protein